MTERLPKDMQVLAGGLASTAAPWLCPAVDLSRDALSAGAALIAYWGKWLKWLKVARVT